jgi:hypothetical protein
MDSTRRAWNRHSIHTAWLLLLHILRWWRATSCRSTLEPSPARRKQDMISQIKNRREGSI